MPEKLNAVAYARFSSDGQRDESIDAQLRAINNFIEQNGYSLLRTFADRGISGTTDNRPEFLSMIDFVKKNKVDAVIVHKLDRFARNRYDSAIYRRELSNYGVKLISVLENFDDSPESIMLQSVIEGYNEYYSKNLRREVTKGLMENARTCRHTGGKPCLGYDVDKETLKYVINPFEAEAVKLIFKMYIDGYGYTAIIDELNRKGFKTKSGRNFGKNSLYDILRNEKYSGVYIYNKSVHPDEDGKFNRHASKSNDEIIRIEGGVPAIISKEDFAIVQKKMNERKSKTAIFKAKEEYLLSGKIICGECGSTYAGNSRRVSGRPTSYISYNCVKRNGKVKCKNTGIRREVIENIILERLSGAVFNEKLLPDILDKYNQYALSRNKSYLITKEELKKKIGETEKGIDNIINVIMQTGSAALSQKLKELEETKVNLENAIAENERKLSEVSIDAKRLKLVFRKARQMLKSGTLKNRKAIVEQYIKGVTVYKDKIEIEYRISDTYCFKETIERSKTAYKKPQ